ncbi:MAG: aminotransferase class I/II-fold pyridoxal phosphate-dependent enzyme [Flavobacteriales bacterium]|nr:L-allo-threonine aldolase [Flavobacteriales bacterium]MCC6577708.1 aminotransferase class I/II-fold pyridoxal phosphate-dependent enzyme [Flavobacteriales bacterium]NUQ14469.1 aminotransferase class I/II-fold pyridoxal phosphate-dependent enzyme [Flavobacteriales bacterium]
MAVPTTIDLRSDTVTKPTPAMREAMLRAEVGDDVFGEDPTVRALEERMAAMFGHEAGLFCTSGTQTNQIAINVHTRPGDEVLCEEGAHIYRYEGGGLMANSGVSVRFVAADRGRFTAAQVEEALNDPDNPHLARTRVVNVENTSNRGGGSVWDLDEVERIRAVCVKHGLALHLDGARIFNAMAVDGTTPARWGAAFDSVSICLSKGLGAPVGSVLVGSQELIGQARRVRKRLGGGMRQAGILAAAGLYALDHHVERLADDHRRAKTLEAALRQCPFVASVMPVATNIVVFAVQGLEVADLLARLRAGNIAAVQFGPGMVRMVTHLDVDDAALERVVDRVAALRT